MRWNASGVFENARRAARPSVCRAVIPVDARCVRPVIADERLGFVGGHATLVNRPAGQPPESGCIRQSNRNRRESRRGLRAQRPDDDAMGPPSWASEDSVAVIEVSKQIQATGGGSDSQMPVVRVGKRLRLTDLASRSIDGEEQVVRGSNC